MFLRFNQRKVYISFSFIFYIIWYLIKKYSPNYLFYSLWMWELVPVGLLFINNAAVTTFLDISLSKHIEGRIVLPDPSWLGEFSNLYWAMNHKKMCASSRLEQLIVNADTSLILLLEKRPATFRKWLLCDLGNMSDYDEYVSQLTYNG